APYSINSYSMAGEKGAPGSHIGFPIVTAKFCTVVRYKPPSYLSVFGSPVYLFVQCWTGRKGQKSASLLEGVFHHETFAANCLVFQRGPPRLSVITML